MRTKKSVFDLNFDVSKQPGSQTRFVSMDGFLGGGIIVQKKPKFGGELSDKRDLRKVFKSNQVPQLLPSHFTRVNKPAKKGA